MRVQGIQAAFAQVIESQCRWARQGAHIGGVEVFEGPPACGGFRAPRGRAARHRAGGGDGGVDHAESKWRAGWCMLVQSGAWLALLRMMRTI